MKAFLKTVIGGALGLGALYVVGKICYEAGKDVAEVERQLEISTAENQEMKEHIEQIKMDLDENLGPVDKTIEHHTGEITKEEFDEIWERNSKPTMLGRLVNKARNAKVFLLAKKTFDKSNKSPGILGSLLTNPDGAKIEAYVRDGGVQISVKPRAA